MTLPEFLRARYAERRAAAENVRHEHVMALPDGSDHSGYSWASVDCNGPENWEHAHFCDPDAVLADLDAKERIIAAYERAAVSSHVHQNVVNIRAELAFTEVLQILAVPFAGHDDYQPRWTP